MGKLVSTRKAAAIVPAALSLIDVGTEMNSDRPSPDQAGEARLRVS